MSSGQYAPLVNKSNQDDIAEDEKSNGRFFPVDDFDMDDDAKKSKSCSGKRIWFIIGFVGVLLVVSVSVGVVVTKNSGLSFGSRHTRSDRKLTFNEVLFEGSFQARRFSCSWHSDSSYLTSNFSSGLVEVSFDAQGQKTSNILVPPETFIIDQYNEQHHDLSPDKEWVMLTKNNKQLFRHSFYANYAAYNIKSKQIITVHPPGGGDQVLRYVGWGTVGNAYVVVFGNNIYYMATVTDTKYTQITTDGVPIQVFNGVPDWVYEEEIIASTHALEFSPDGRFMAYVNFNASQVPFYKFPKYGSVDDSYTTIDRIAYPKAGYANPTVTFYIKDLHELSKAAVHLIPPDSVRYGDHYYSVMKWASNSQLYVNWLNRAQNYTESVIYDAINGARATIETHVTKHGWVNDDYPKPYFASDASFYITMLPREQEHGAGRFRHIAKVSLKDQSVTFLTSGRWEVAGMSCYNPKTETLFYKSTETSPSQRHIYSLKLKTKEKKCVTCDLAPGCQYYMAQFSKQCTWANLMCQGPGVPRTDIYNLNTMQKIVMADNEKLKERLAMKDVPKVVKYEIMNDGYRIAVKETRPHNFDENKEYAVLFDVYGGPGTQKVYDVYEIFFDEYLVSNYDIIVIGLDARGTGYQGENFMHAIYKKLGYYEAKDTIAVGKHLQKQKYINPDKLCIWGWSYGGFLSSTVLATGSGVFHCAIAVAPVSDWRYYDTVYSERYMGMPTRNDNLVGYRETSIMPYVKNMTGSDFLLVHGTADDNVHFQNSAHLAFALIEAGIQFRTQFYTDKDHGIQGNGASPHLYHLLSNFLESKLKLQSSS